MTDLRERGSPVLLIHELVVSAALRTEILQHLTQSTPNEGVGLLSGTIGTGVLTAVRYYPGRNLLQSPTRFQLDPRDLMGALRDMRANGTELGAIVHSHLYGPPTPSETDLAEWAYPEALSVIVSLRHTEPELRAFQIISANDVVAIPVTEATSPDVKAIVGEQS